MKTRNLNTHTDEHKTGDADNDDDEQAGNEGSEFRCGNKEDSGNCSADRTMTDSECDITPPSR